MKELSLREQQLVALEILKYFDKICQDNQIKYSLGGGTLIGAVRHHGFIPWDDDVDVYMHRDDYEKFVLEWKKLTHSRYEISLLEDINGANPGEMTKIYDNSTKHIALNGSENRIFIDIFVWDTMPSIDHKDSIYKIMKRNKWFKHYFSLCRKRWIRSKEGTFRYSIFRFFSHIFFNKIISNLSNFRKLYPRNKNNYIGLILSEYKDWEKYYMPSEYFEKLVYLDFEGAKYPVMSGYHYHLTKYYGNYMEYPPQEERKPYHYIGKVYLLH